MISKTLRLSHNTTAHYLEQGEGEPLVLVHGVGLQAMAWHPQIAYFSTRYRVIAMDMPGHGRSARIQDDANLRDYVHWMHACLEQLSVGPVNLAGHSMGSLIAAGTAIEYPERVKRMAVLNGVYRRSARARKAVMQRAQALWRGEMDIETPLRRWFTPDAAQHAITAQVRSWLAQVDRAGYATAYTAFAQGDDVYADRWSSIQCPTLALTGADDGNSTAAMARTMARRAKNGQAVVIAGERHMVNLTAPDAVNQAMQNWLQMD